MAFSDDPLSPPSHKPPSNLEVVQLDRTLLWYLAKVLSLRHLGIDSIQPYLQVLISYIVLIHEARLIIIWLYRNAHSN